MNDEIVEEEQTEEVVEESKAPAWDFTPSPTPEEKPVTAAQVAQIVAQHLSAKEEREVGYEEEIINKAVQQATGQMAQFYAQQTRDAEAERLTNRLTKGLPDESRDYVEGFLAKFDGTQLQMLKADKDTLDLIRRAAEFEGMKGKGPAKTANAPRSEGTQTVEKHSDSKIAAEVDKMWNQGFKNIPGMTKEKLMERMQAASRELN